MPSPTALTLRRLRAAGYTAVIAERRNHHAGITQDLYGWQDVQAIRADKPGVLAVQVTSEDHAADRLAKLLAAPSVRTWLQAGNRAVVHGWVKRGGLWRLRERWVNLFDFAEVIR